MKIWLLFKNTISIFSYLFLFYLIGYSICFFCATLWQSFRIYQIQRQQKLKNRLKNEYYIPISILLYTYNDEKKIVKKVKNLLKLNYKLYEIIIIDDGSSDKTLEVLKKAFSFKQVDKPLHKQLKTKKIKEIYQADEHGISITLLRKDHDGRVDALHTGINFSSYPYFICIHTHYTLEKDALENLMRPTLESDKVMVCIGDVMVGSLSSNNTYLFPKDVLSMGQVTEYNNASLSLFKNTDTKLTSLVLFKKDIVISSLGYEEHMLGENFELILRIKEYCHMQNIEYVSSKALHAVSFLEVPNTLSSFIAQRKNFSKCLGSSFSRYVFPILKFVGVFSLLLSLIFSILPISSVFFFLSSYILFCTFLSLCHFISKLIFENVDITVSTFIKAALCSFLEQTVICLLSFLSSFSFGRKEY